MFANFISSEKFRPVYTTLDSWILHEAIPFSVDSSETFNTSFEKVIASLDDSVELQALEKHSTAARTSYSQPALPALSGGAWLQRHCHREQFPSGAWSERLHSRSRSSIYEAIPDTLFSHGFGRLDANRELIEWIRAFNVDPSHCVKLQFSGTGNITVIRSKG